MTECEICGRVDGFHYLVTDSYGDVQVVCPECLEDLLEDGEITQDEFDAATNYDEDDQSQYEDEWRHPYDY